MGGGSTEHGGAEETRPTDGRRDHDPAPVENAVSPGSPAMEDRPIDPEVLRTYFYWLGLTFHSRHQLEYGVKTVLVTMADMGFGGCDLSEMIAIIEDDKKKTLGQVLDLLRQRVTLSEGWANSPSIGLEARNRFVHRFLSEVDDRVADPNTRADVITEIKAIRALVLQADRAVQQILETLFEHAGLNWQALRSEQAEHIRKMNTPTSFEPPEAKRTG
jgi:hypothetical protein